MGIIDHQFCNRMHSYPALTPNSQPPSPPPPNGKRGKEIGKRSVDNICFMAGLVRLYLFFRIESCLHFSTVEVCSVGEVDDCVIDVYST